MLLSLLLFTVMLSSSSIIILILQTGSEGWENLAYLWPPRELMAEVDSHRDFLIHSHHVMLH